MEKGIKLIHVISSIDKSSGGPARSVTHLIEGILHQNDDIYIQLDTLKSPQPLLKAFKEKNGGINFYDSNQLKKELAMSNVHLFHGHGLWEMPVHQMANAARIRRIPYIITPRGMLDDWSLNHKKLKKKNRLVSISG